MEKTLFKLDFFCSNLGLDYIITGTTALYLNGFPMPSKPKDIDILVTKDLTPEQVEAIKMQEFISGLEKVDYPDSKVWAFYIDKVKVNIIVSGFSKEALIESSNSILLGSEKDHKFLVKVQKVKPALEDKMFLARDKDRKFMLDVFYELVFISKCKCSMI